MRMRGKFLCLKFLKKFCEGAYGTLFALTASRIPGELSPQECTIIVFL